ncbi:MAG: NAD(P)H-dependent oxidoreductase [Acidobacteriota bacterium]
MSAPRVLALSGSSRRESLNTRLVTNAARGVEAAGVSCTVLDWSEFSLPLYDGDLEAESGMPEDAARLQQLFIEHQGLLIASPEHNSSYTALFKNLVDWISRSPEGEPPLVALKGKTAAVMAASPGALGGLRGLVPLRMLLGNLGVTVLPDQITVRQAMKAFDAEGRLVDDTQRERVEGLGRQLAENLLKVHRD